MIVRKATIADMETLIKLRLDYLATDKGSLTEEEEKVIRSQLLEYFKKNIGQNCVAVFAEENGKVISTAFLAISEKPANPSFITGKTGTLLNVLTYPEYRRRGYATKVISEIIDESRRLGLSYIELSATEDGKPVYEKLGFIERKSKYTEMVMRLV